MNSLADRPPPNPSPPCSSLINAVSFLYTFSLIFPLQVPKFGRSCSWI
ncbi:hypothetical protein Hanom_Chr07g00680091 [Helianthus anomalus]